MFIPPGTVDSHGKSFQGQHAFLGKFRHPLFSLSRLSLKCRPLSLYPFFLDVMMSCKAGSALHGSAAHLVHTLLSHLMEDGYTSISQPIRSSFIYNILPIDYFLGTEKKVNIACLYPCPLQ